MLFILLLPIIISLFLILFLNQNSQKSGIIGICFAFLIASFFPELILNSDTLKSTFLNTMILSMSAFFVILPGLTLSNLLEKKGYNESFREYIKELPITLHYKVLILIFGLLPAIESITGFGISLILAVPFFFSVFDKKTASYLSMLSMNIMPWGTLGLATIVGAKISGHSLAELGLTTFYFTPFIFIFFCSIILFLIKREKYYIKDFVFAVFLISLFSITLYAVNLIGQVELAGAITGFTTFFLISSIFLLKNRKSLLNYFKSFTSIMMPYILVISFIVILKIIVLIFPFLIDYTTIHGVGTSFVFISSPFFAMALAIMCMSFKNKTTFKVPISKTFKASSTLFIFIFLAQFMSFSGFIRELSLIAENQKNILLYNIISPLFALLSGFITGSNLGGNALLIAIQNNLGNNINNSLVFSATQNAGAGYAVFTSMPIIILIITIANNSYQGIQVLEKDMLKFGLKCLFGVYICLVSMLYLILH